MNSVTIYDDHILITFNYRYGETRLDFSDIESSDLQSVGGPKPPQNIGFEAVFITFQAIIYLAFYISRVSNVGKALLLICFAFSP